jgi:HD-GYP domain-containing protein (c-di-GMP phosphodiesterase class II)
MLSQTTMNANQDIMQGVLQHHERCDGSGYPSGLKGDKISKFGKILAILDIYDAMASDRVFAKRKSPFDVFSTLYDDILDGKLDTE